MSFNGGIEGPSAALGGHAVALWAALGGHARCRLILIGKGGKKRSLNCFGQSRPLSPFGLARAALGGHARCRPLAVTPVVPQRFWELTPVVAQDSEAPFGWSRLLSCKRWQKGMGQNLPLAVSSATEFGDFTWSWILGPSTGCKPLGFGPYLGFVQSKNTGCLAGHPDFLSMSIEPCCST